MYFGISSKERHIFTILPKPKDVTCRGARVLDVERWHSGLDAEDAEERVVCSPGRRAVFISPITFPEAKVAPASTYFLDKFVALTCLDPIQ